jgi:mannose-6-phosphate isomerase-like protein (cupin superfamily)
MTVTVVTAEQGESFAIGPLRTRILEDGTRTSSRLGVVEVTIAPGASGPPQHIHHRHDETFFVVSGVVRFTSAAEQIDVMPGGLLTAPIGVPHTFGNPDGDAPAVMVCTVTPDLYINYFRELGATAAATSGPLQPDAIVGIMSRYATEPYRQE